LYNVYESLYNKDIVTKDELEVLSAWLLDLN